MRHKNWVYNCLFVNLVFIKLNFRDMKDRVLFLTVVTIHMFCFSQTSNYSKKSLGSNSINAKSQVAPEHYPEFSWKTIPQYLHIRKNTGYTETEIDYMSGFPLITLEKSQGWKDKDIGNTEAGARKAAVQIKSKQKENTILYYRNAIINWDHYKKDDAFIKENPDALLRNESGDLVYMPNGSTPYFDITKDYVKEYWLNSVIDMVKGKTNFDGVFIDANIKVLADSYFSGRVGEFKQKALENAYFSMMTILKNRLGNNKLMLANIIRVRPDFVNNGLDFIDYFDGSYLESFDVNAHEMKYEDYVSDGIKAVQTAARKGKIIAMTLGLGESIDNELDSGIDDKREDVNLDKINSRIDYLCGIFLICAEKYSYLNLHDGYLASQSLVWQKKLEQFKKPLGRPKERAVKNGYIYTRSFENVDVRVNIKQKTAVLDWHSLRKDNSWYHNHTTGDLNAFVADNGSGDLKKNAISPDKSGERVSKFIKGNDTHSSIKFELPNGLPRQKIKKGVFKISVYTKTNSIVDNNNIKLVLRNSNDRKSQISKSIDITQFDSWVNYTFDMSELSLDEDYYDEINLVFASPNNDGTGKGAVYYFDAFQGPNLKTLNTESTVSSLKFKLYPNPAQNILNFSDKVLIGRVYNIYGQLVETILNTNKVNVLHYASGIYFLKVELESGELINEKFKKK